MPLLSKHSYHILVSQVYNKKPPFKIYEISTPINTLEY